MNKKLVLFLTFAVFSLVLCLNISDVKAAEGGYSNYIPGFYGDFGLAVEPPTEFSVRNDTYYYSADERRQAEVKLFFYDEEEVAKVWLQSENK